MFSPIRKREMRQPPIEEKTEIRTVATHWVLCAVLLLLTGAAPTAAETPSGPVPGRFVIKLAPTCRAADLQRNLTAGEKLRKPSQLRLRDDLEQGESFRRVFTFHTDDTAMTAGDLKNRLGPENIEWVEPEYYLEFFDYPSDPLFPHQWGLHNTGQAYFAVDRLEGDYNDTLMLEQGTAGNDAGISYYYDNPPAVSTAVVVAIIDSGADLVHPELQGRFWHNPDEIANNGLDDDHNGFIDDTLGYDVSGDTLTLIDPQMDNDPTDSVGHGTHCAGIVAARQDGVGVVGLAPRAEIMAVKIRPNATTTVGALGILYAVNAGADIINVSWGTPYEAEVLREALNVARANGVFVAIAAGNTGGNDVMYPASFDSAFAVAAGNSSGQVTWFSTWGPQIDVVAPGSNILSLRAAGTDMYASTQEPGVHIIGDDSLYYLADGTSMAAPMVAGAAALMLSIRPDLTLQQLESFLRLGARDIVDPFGLGDSLVGPDTVSGYGYIDVHGSLLLATQGGLHFTAPVNKSRYTDSIYIKAAATGSYAGGWQLAYATDTAPDNWQLLAEGEAPPPDSLLHVFSVPSLNDHITFRLTDDFGTKRYVQVVYVSGQALQLTCPRSGEEYTYNIPVSGFVYGSELDSAALFYIHGTGSPILLAQTTGEYFDSLIFDWNASGISLGEYRLYLYGYFGANTYVDSVDFILKSAFTSGWPQSIAGRGALSPVCADLDNDGQKEIIIGTSYGLQVFHGDGQPVSGFPALVATDVRSVPAIYDIDRDGQAEIICVNEEGLHAFNHDGSYVPGWPVECVTGSNGLGCPHATVTELNAFEDSAIVLINDNGQVLAWEFDGSSYFYSLEGWFASFSTETSSTYHWSVDAVSSADLDGDDRREVIVTYSGISSTAGVALFDGRTGQPAFDRPLPYVLEAGMVLGSVLGDLTGDGRPEIVVCGFDTTSAATIWIKTDGVYDLPGWPVQLPDARGWRGNPPMLADLDLDGVPEIMVSFFGFDISSLYIFRIDGTPYRNVEGRPYGEAYSHPTTFSMPIVANLTGDEHPEITFRSGYILPGTGSEQVHVLDYTLTPIPGWPMSTPAPAAQVFSTPYVPFVDDIDGDSLVELVIVSDAAEIYAWDFDASVEVGENTGRLFVDNLNSNVFGDTAAIYTDVDEEPASRPNRFCLHQNYPNPFNPATTIAFEIPKRAKVRLDIFNILGRKVVTLVNDVMPSGEHTVQFDGSRFASGVYLYRLRTDENETTRKMVLVK